MNPCQLVEIRPLNRVTNNPTYYHIHLKIDTPSYIHHLEDGLPVRCSGYDHPPIYKPWMAM